MQTKLVDLRTSAHNSPALGGLAASPAHFARGSTLSPFPWIPAHVAIQSMAICIGGRQNLRRWPFVVTAAAEDRASFSSHEASAEGAGRATPPDGNHGGYFSGERTSV